MRAGIPAPHDQALILSMIRSGDARVLKRARREGKGGAAAKAHFFRRLAAKSARRAREAAGGGRSGALGLLWARPGGR